MIFVDDVDANVDANLDANLDANVDIRSCWQVPLLIRPCVRAAFLAFACTNALLEHVLCDPTRDP